MNKRILPLVLVLTFLGTFWVLQSKGSNETEDPIKEKHSRILKNVGILLEQAHYSPQTINDEFSQKVLKEFFRVLDPDKNVFYQADIDELTAKFGNAIDDEIKGQAIHSFYEIVDVYNKRMAEVMELYPKHLQKPFDFNIDEKVQLDGKLLNYPKTAHDRNDSWRKRVKYLVLSKYVDLQEEQEKKKGKEDYKAKPDSTLERESRDAIAKQLNRYFSTKKNRETQEELFSRFVNTISYSMDPHTNYYPPVDLRSFNESMSGRFYGIGAQLKEEDGKILIASLVTSGPAWKNGELQENDEVIKVGEGDKEPVDVTGYSVSDAVKLIRGSKKGSEVRLTVKKPDGTIKVISLLRDEIKLEDTFVKSAIIQEGDSKVGYIYLPEFYADFEKVNGARCAVDMERELEKLKREKVDGIIIDLRGNGGGSLYDVVQIVGLFVPEGPVVQVKGRGANNFKVYNSEKKSVVYSGPLAVLVDETSASASEIFAAAIQDYKRGIILGSTSTYGKGTVQRQIPLSPGNRSIFKSEDEDLGSLKLTLQKFYRINGDATQLKGVIPDIILPDRLEYLKFREKDVPQSLQWDEFKKLNYMPWKGDYSVTSIINEVSPTILENPVFSSIKKEVDWLEANNDRTYSLKLKDFKSFQKHLKKVYENLDSLCKLPTPMNVRNLQEDVAVIEAAEDRKEKNKIWIDRIKQDIYIDQTLKVLNKMITQANTAKLRKVESVF